jgi:hypothetical protein
MRSLYDPRRGPAPQTARQIRRDSRNGRALFPEGGGSRESWNWRQCPMPACRKRCGASGSHQHVTARPATAKFAPVAPLTFVTVIRAPTIGCGVWCRLERQRLQYGLALPGSAQISIFVTTPPDRIVASTERFRRLMHSSLSSVYGRRRAQKFQILFTDVRTWLRRAWILRRRGSDRWAGVGAFVGS